LDVSQNLISIQVTTEMALAVRNALGVIEETLPDLIAMEAGERRGLMIMGPKSEPFVRKTLRVLEQNPKIVPGTLDLAGAQADLAAYDQLQPLLERMQRLMARLDDTVAALGSDLMDVALEGYAQIKLSGGAEGLDDLRREIGGRFAKQRARRPVAEPA
jgi:hypothetical protein